MDLHPKGVFCAALASLKVLLAHQTGHDGWRRVRPPLLPLPQENIDKLLAAGSALKETV